jgi:hypothetical protein
MTYKETIERNEIYLRVIKKARDNLINNRNKNIDELDIFESNEYLKDLEKEL